MRKLLAVSVLTAIAVMSTACKKSSVQKESTSSGTGSTADYAPKAPGGSGSIKVTYQSNVKTMEMKEVEDSILGQSSDGAALLFDASNEMAKSLKAGDVLLVKGMIARKVLGAETEPEGVIVLTQQATIPEVVQDGTIDVQAPIRFGDLQAETKTDSRSQLAKAWGAIWPEKVYAQEAQALQNAEAKGTRDAYGNLASGAFHSLVDGWDTKFSATPGGGNLKLDLTMTREVGGVVAKITGQGNIANFDFSSYIGVTQSRAQRLESRFKNLNGVMNFQWEISKDSPGALTDAKTRIKLPSAIEIPLAQYLDGFPLFLEISGALIIKPAISGGKEYSKGSFRINYDGTQHFRVNNGNVDSDGNVTGDIEIPDPQNISPTTPLGMVVAFAAPRIELSFGTAKIFKMADFKKAASVVDPIADRVAKRVLSSDQYQAFKGGPLGNFSMGQAIDTALKSDAAAYFEMVSSAGMSDTGMSAIAPCSRTDVSLSGVVGASAETFGMSLGETKKEIFKKDMSKIVPPGIKLCQDLNN
jgi:hypothetical protein